MNEITTGLTILTSALGGAAVGGKLIERLLGPTTDYIGLELRAWTEMRVNNVARIFKKANEKLGDKISSPGSIPPRVLQEILQEGSYCDNELMSEYYGGILASGRSPDGKDDRATSFLKLTSGLSAYQIRLHYIAYTVFRSLYLGTGLRPTFEEDLGNMTTFFPEHLLAEAMNLEGDREQFFDILFETQMSLNRTALLEPTIAGSQQHLNESGKKLYWGRWIEVNESGFILRPTQSGIDYYLWATGNGRFGRRCFLAPELKIAELSEIKIGGTAKVAVKGGS